MKRALKWLGIGVLSVVVLGVVLGIIFGEAEEQPAASVSTPTAVPIQAPEGQPSTEAEAASQHNLDGQDYFDAGKYLLALTEFKMIQDPIARHATANAQDLRWTRETGQVVKLQSGS